MIFAFALKSKAACRAYWLSRRDKQKNPRPAKAGRRFYLETGRVGQARYGLIPQGPVILKPYMLPLPPKTGSGYSGSIASNQVGSDVRTD
jgi:hypothetical protein